ncbi:hypothetical protein BH09VER1_BH09VER1_31620 [soil metagenome]
MGWLRKSIAGNSAQVITSFKAILLASLFCCEAAAWAESPVGPYAQWANGPSKKADYFPIAVWLQSPDHAARYQKLGINLFVALWEGPTSEQLASLKAAGMPVICEQNQVGLTDKNNDIIVGWMHGDEPDNAQPQGTGYGSPISPQVIEDDYRKIVAADPTRPVLLNLGQGVAWDEWVGRGVRTNHPEDYPDYVKGGDIVSFDIYPVVHDHLEIAGRLELVPFGVDRLRQWSEDRRPIWTCIECTHIGNPKVKPTPAQVRSEVWMAIIHGAQGLIYFAHEFSPVSIEAGLLQDEEMSRAIGEINHQITELAPVLNSPSIFGATAVAWKKTDAPVSILVKRDAGAIYVFAVAMRNQPATTTISVKESATDRVEVLGENRTLPVKGGTFTDQFAPYAVHLYRLPVAR